jgi:hypothetical protein
MLIVTGFFVSYCLLSFFSGSFIPHGFRYAGRYCALSNAEGGTGYLYFYKDAPVMWHTLIIFHNLLKDKNFPPPEFVKEHQRA